MEGGGTGPAGRDQRGLVEWNARIHRWKGVGAWRALYLWFLRDLGPSSLIEFGSGDPSFLSLVAPACRRIAVDGNPALARDYAAAGIEFHCLDLDRDGLPEGLSGLGAAVCSDVFEHLVFPARLLGLIAGCLGPEGVLFSHVPNEFRWRRTWRIVLGRRTSVYHHGAEEWNDPHLRRFTDIGYRRFLSQRFRYNLKINDLRYRGWARTLARLRIPVPYGLEGGPTYASTNNDAVYRRLVEIKERLRRDRAFQATRGGVEGLAESWGIPGDGGPA